MGTGEIALRMSSITTHAWSGLSALPIPRGSCFDWDVAIIAAVVFCLHPIIISEAIDVRPYPFAALAITSSIFALVRLRHNNSNWLAALCSASRQHASFISNSCSLNHYLPGFGHLLFPAIKVADRKTLWRSSLGVALVSYSP